MRPFAFGPDAAFILRGSPRELWLWEVLPLMLARLAGREGLRRATAHPRRCGIVAIALIRLHQFGRSEIQHATLNSLIEVCCQCFHGFGFLRYWAFHLD